MTSLRNKKGLRICPEHKRLRPKQCIECSVVKQLNDLDKKIWVRKHSQFMDHHRRKSVAPVTYFKVNGVPVICTWPNRKVRRQKPIGVQTRCDFLRKTPGGRNTRKVFAESGLRSLL